MRAARTAVMILAVMAPALPGASAGQTETAAEAAAGRAAAIAARHGGLGEAAGAPGTATAPRDITATLSALTALATSTCFDPARAQQVTADADLPQAQRATLARLIETTADDPALLAAALAHATQVMP